LTLDWSQCTAVESIPGKVSGAWVLRGTRTPVKVLFEKFPVTRDQIDSLMGFVARSLEKEPVYAEPAAHQHIQAASIEHADSPR
jgi:uncharacterized protein (DUF433 family)